MKVNFKLEGHVSAKSPIREFRIQQHKGVTYALMARSLDSKKQQLFHILDTSQNLILLMRHLRQYVKGDIAGKAMDQANNGKAIFFEASSKL